jgi:hypothetical protein
VLHTTNDDSSATAIPAEQDLLGALISGAATLADLPGFQSDWFSDPVHSTIYRAIEAQAANGSLIDLASLSSILAPCSEIAGGIEPGCELEDIGGPAYLAEIAGRSFVPIVSAALMIRFAWLRHQPIGQTLVADAGESL